MNKTELLALAERDNSKKREGPHISIKAVCYGCQYERAESFRVQGDSGVDQYCDHPDRKGKHVSSYCHSTPDWCPFGQRMAAALRAIAGGADE